MAKFRPDATTQALLDALKNGLRGLEHVRLFSSPEEEQGVAELKAALRARIAELEGLPESKAADD